MDQLAVDSRKKAQLQQVADLLLQIYKTLVRMQYLVAECIEEGPRVFEKDKIDHYKSHGLDDSVIYLYSILPRIEPQDRAGDFYDGGEFYDFLDDVEQGRDPFYLGGEDEREILSPSMTPLSMMGNHRTALIYCAKSHCIWIRTQQGNCDPNFEFDGSNASDAHEHDDSAEGKGQDTGNHSEDENENEEEQASECSDAGSDDNDDDDEWDSDDQSEDDPAYSTVDARPADEVLRDINRCYLELITLPGDGEHSPLMWDEALSQPLYEKLQWPSKSFDGDAFLVELLKAYTAQRVREDAEWPLVRAKAQAKCVEDRRSEPYWAPWHKNIEQAETEDDKWLCRFELWKQKSSVKRDEKELEQCNRDAEIQCPNGVALTPEGFQVQLEETLRNEMYGQQDSAAKAQREVNQLKASGKSVPRNVQVKLAVAEKQARIHARAHRECRAEAQRLYPETSFKVGRTPLRMAAFHKDRLDKMGVWKEIATDEIHAAREWSAQLPEEAWSAKKRIGEYVEEREARLANFDEDCDDLVRLIAKCEKQEAEDEAAAGE